MTEDDLPRSPAPPDAPAGPADAAPAPEGDGGRHGADAADPDPGLAAGAGESEKRRRGRPKGATSSARTTRVVELCLTVSEGADGEWQAELKQGAAWISRGLPVSAASVLRAAQVLHSELDA